MNTNALAGIVALTALGAATASADWALGMNPALLGRGGVGVGLLSNEWTTGAVNPGALGAYKPWGEAGDERPIWMGSWTGEYGAALDLDGNSTWSAGGAARDLNSNWGVGLGYADWDGFRLWDVSAGMRAGPQRGPIATGLGVTLNIPDTPYPGDDPTVDVGALQTTRLRLPHTSGIVSAGAVVRDVTGVTRATWDAGIGLTFPTWRVGLDFVDISNQFNRLWAIGGEYRPLPYLTLRIGDYDSNFTFGGSVGHKGISLDYGHMDAPFGGTSIDQIGLRYTLYGNTGSGY